jgi:transcriptional regulator with XRE-family HTH domain
MHTKDPEGRNSPTAKRLRALRKAEGGDNSTAWAKRMGMSLPQLSNFEGGVPLARNPAINMAKRIPGLTTDWLFLGREEGLPVDLRRRLRDAAKKVDEEDAEDIKEDANSEASAKA